MKRVHILISGIVQGVFFRHTTKAEAEKLGITGWVRNTEDDKVEIVVEGEEEQLEQLIHWVHQGPALSQVEKVEVNWQEPTGEFSGFEIK